MNLQILSTILASFSLVSIISALVLIRYRNRGLQMQVVHLEQRLQKEKPAPGSFSQDLARIEKEVITPRPHQVRELPDRYRYVCAMARQGMRADQIAAALQIGEVEAAQIIRLSRLNRSA